MLVSQLGKVKAKSIIFKSTGFWVVGTPGMPSWRQWTTSTPKQTHAKKKNQKQISQFSDCRSKLYYWPQTPVTLALSLSCLSRLLGELSPEEFGPQALKDPHNFFKRQKNCFCVTVEDFISLLSSFLTAEHRLVASLQKALWDACCNMHINYH